MGERAGWTDAEVLADLTQELPLVRYCLIAGRIYTWVRLRQSDGDLWLPLGLLIENNAFAQVTPGVLCRAGVRTFRSVEEAVEWGRSHAESVFQAESDAVPSQAA